MAADPKRSNAPLKGRSRHAAISAGGFAAAGALIYVLGFSPLFATEYQRPDAKTLEPVWPAPLDKGAYNDRMLALAHYSAATSTELSASTTPPMLPVWTATTSVSIPGKLWPAPAAYPHGGALLPFNRIVAYYGNFYSTKMGVLGEYPTEEVIAKLKQEEVEWEAADPSTPVIPAIHYIAVVAQAGAGKDGKYRLRMPDDQIDHALTMAAQVNGIVFLDIQVGKSDLQSELPELEKYLSMPNVHLGIDPEFSMKFGHAPGTVIGTFDAEDINYAASYLAGLVRQHKLPPKVLVVHRFTQNMMTNYQNIMPLPEVQIVVDMDGWGSQAKKKGTYRYIVAPEPVQFTGVKLFYRADLKAPSTGLLTKEEVLDFMPKPIYIQYQ